MRPALLVCVLLTVGCGAPGREDAGAPDRGDVATPGRDETGCQVGAERASLWPGRPAVVLGCGRTPAGAAVVLSSFRDDAGPCLAIDGLPGGTRACGRAPSERVPPTRRAIGGGVFVQRSPGAPRELYGETAPEVRRVLLRFRLPDGRVGRRAATLIPVTDAGALRAAAIREPFGYFTGTVPPRATRIAAVALGPAGEPLGRLRYDPIVRDLHPKVFIASEG